MTRPSISIFIARPQGAGYKPLATSPYYDQENDLLSNNLLCPRYAENDSSSAPPSPASIESFDILDSIAWRRGYTTYGTGAKARSCEALRKRWRKNRAAMIAVVLVVALLVVGASVAGYLALRHVSVRNKETCLAREGGDRCADPAWAQCIAVNGVGYCEGIM